MATKTETKPKPAPKAKPPRVRRHLHQTLGSCTTAKAIEAGACRSSVSAADWHAQCKGSHNGTYDHTSCDCSCHAATQTRDAANPPRCLTCNSADSELVTELGPLAGTCVDSEGCHERFMAMLADSPRWQKLQEARAAGQAARAERAVKLDDRGEPAPTRRPRGEGKPKTGRCEHCGQPTKGGKFVAGHDAKLKGDLKRAAEAGEIEAVVELLVRDWPTHTLKIDRALALEAAGMHDDVNQAWLDARVENRIAAVTA